MIKYVSFVCLFLVFCKLGISQKYTVEDDQVFVKDSAYYNFRSVNYLGGEIKKINTEFDNIQTQIEALSDESNVKSNSVPIGNLKSELSELRMKIKSLEVRINTDVDKKSKVPSVTTSKALWLPWIGILGIAGFMFYLFNKLKRSLRGYDTDIRNVQKDLLNTTTKSQSKLVNFINDQLGLKFDIEKLQAESNKELSKVNSVDHSLALKLADEITKMESNLSLMDSKVKGHRQLSRGVVRLRDNLAANGYEITELLGIKYSEGMKNSATFIIDESLEKGTQVISNVLKPEILFNGKMIQSAQIEVTQN